MIPNCRDCPWTCPKIGVPPNHLFFIQFFLANHPFSGAPHFRKPPCGGLYIPWLVLESIYSRKIITFFSAPNKPSENHQCVGGTTYHRHAMFLPHSLYVKGLSRYTPNDGNATMGNIWKKTYVFFWYIISDMPPMGFLGRPIWCVILLGACLFMCFY